jgi:putative phosphoribosyl transferase
MRFRDRRDAGRCLAAAMRDRVWGDVVVVGLPRGGVPVAAEVARALDAPLDVLCVRKLGVPASPELAMGAIGEGGVRVLDRGLVVRLAISDRAIAAVEAREREELARQAVRYRAGRCPVELEDRTVVVVDDGLATGATARAAALSARRRGARRVVLAVPVGAPESVDTCRLGVDDVVAVTTPRHFRAVGAWYEDFGATTDEEVLAALRDARPVGPAAADTCIATDATES